MRVPVLLAALVLVAGPAWASTHYGPEDNGGPEENGTAMPGPEESTEMGPYGNDAGVGWFLSGLVLFVLALGAGVALFMRQTSLRDRERPPP